MNRKGFTLIELVAVIIILAVIMMVSIPSVIKAINNQRTKELTRYCNTIKNTTEIYVQEYRDDKYGEKI